MKCDIEKLEKGFSVSCFCKDMDVILMDLKLFAPDFEQASLIKEKILQNPTEFYSNVLDYVLDNKEYIPDIAEI